MFHHRESRAQQCSIVFPVAFIQLFLPLLRPFFLPALSENEMEREKEGGERIFPSVSLFPIRHRGSRAILRAVVLARKIFSFRRWTLRAARCTLNSPLMDTVTMLFGNYHGTSNIRSQRAFRISGSPVDSETAKLSVKLTPRPAHNFCLFVFRWLVLVDVLFYYSQIRLFQYEFLNKFYRNDPYRFQYKQLRYSVQPITTRR